MNFKIIGSFFILLFMAMSVNATTYLNSCGKNSSWVNGETYILNFTEVPSTYTNINCFTFDNSYSNITFNQITDKINIDTPQYMIFFQLQSRTLDNFSFNNINLNFINNTNYIFRSVNGVTRLINSNFNNISIVNNVNGYFYQGIINSKYGGELKISNNYINNIFLKKTEFIYLDNIQPYAGYATSNKTLYLENNSINNVFQIHNSNTLGFINIRGGDIYTQYATPFYYNNNTFSNIVSTKSITYPIHIEQIYPYWHTYTSNNIVQNSMFPNYKTFIDNDNNGIGDTGEVWNYSTIFTNPAIFKNLFGYTFIQDVKYGFRFTNPNDKIISISKENLTTNDLIMGANDNKQIKFLGDINLDNRQAIDMGTTNSINCSILNDDYCIFSDLQYSGTTSGEFKPLIAVNSNDYINNIWIEKNSNSNNANLLANSISSTRTNLEIENSNFLKQDSRSATGDEQIINLNFNNLKLHNNSFYTGGASNTNYEMLSINSPAPESNKIYNNFFDSGLSSIGTTQIFTNHCDADFYFNKIDGNYVITNGCTGDLNVNPLIGFKNEQDGKIYYFYGGNYYMNNNNCNDSDSDGYCDLPYTSGNITDNYPLSEYPFDWTSHLFNAVKVIDNTNFNITIFVPQAQNLVYNLAGTSESLEFQFSHNSNFSDLSCDYIINGQPVHHLSNVNNSKQTIYLNGFDEGYYSFYVECYNDFKYKSSDLYSFFVNLPGGDTPPANYTGGTGGTGSTGSTGGYVNGSLYEQTSIIGNSTTQTTDNIVSWFGGMSSGVISIAQTLGVFLFVILAIGGVMNLIS